MAPEEPSRRSSENQEPETIGPEATGANAEIPAEPHEQATVNDAAPDAEAAVADLLSSETPPLSEPADATAPEHASPAIAPVQKTGTSVTGAVAAGIFGGLVALAGAGSMQYAGYIPSMRAETAVTPAAPVIDTAAFEAEITALKNQVAALETRPAPASDTSALEARLAALEAAPAAQTQAQPLVDLAPLEQKLSTLSGELSQLEGSLAETEQKQTSMQTGLVDRLQKVEAEVNDPSRRNAVARAIAASGLKAAIDRGGAFLTELETFAGVAAADPAVAGLKPYAETGVPTRTMLAADFPEAANAVLAVIDKPDPDQNLGARLWSSAVSLVKVRPVGQVEGDTPEAFIARSENALKNGDLDKALAEWNRLPEEARSATGFGKALAARIEVENLVGATLRDAVTGAAAN